MGDFDDFIQEIEAEAEAEGPEAVAMLQALDAHFSFASDLIDARKSAQMTQRQLAESSGVPQSEISRFESGRGNPTLETIGRLSAALGRRMRLLPHAAPIQ